MKTIHTPSPLTTDSVEPRVLSAGDMSSMFRTPLTSDSIRGVTMHLLQSQGRVDKNGRADAGETLMFTRMLESFYGKILMTPYTGSMIGPSLFPTAIVSPIDEKFTYRQCTGFVESAPVTGYSEASDYPAAELNGQEATTTFKWFGNSFNVSLDDLARASAYGIPLDSMKATLCREAHARKIDVLTATGSTALSLNGLTTSGIATDISRVSTTKWDGAGVTVADIENDFKALVQAPFAASLGIHKANKVILSTKLFLVLQSTNFNTFDARSLIQVFEAKYGVSITHWSALNAADSGGKGLIVAYDDAPNNGQLLIPVPFEMSAPHPTPFGFRTYCRMRTGGFQMRFPLAYAKMSGCET